MSNNYNISAEQNVLSSLLYAPEKFDIHSKELTEDTFYLPSHKDIYKVMYNLHKNDKPIDEEFIKKDLMTMKKFDDRVMLEIMSIIANSYIMNYIVELQELHRNREINNAILKFQHGEIEHIKLASLIEKSKNIYAKEEVQKSVQREYKYLTPFMKELLLDLKSINDYPDSMVWSVMLPSMAGLIGARAKITNGINLTVPPVIWSMIVAPSSLAAKSTLYKTSMKCIFGDMQKDFYADYDNKKEIFKIDHKGYMASSKEEKLGRDEPEPPTLEQIVFHAGGTPEAKIKSLQHNPNGGIVYYDEMKAELELTNANQQYKALKTSIFDGDTFHKELVNGGTIILHSPILSEVGLITKPWLLEVAQKNDIASGFMARYLFSVNSREDFRPLQIDSSFKLNTEKYSKVGKFIIEIFKNCEDTVIFQLSDEARQTHTEWFNAYSRDVYDTETDEEATASYRLSTYVLKFMLISYIFNNAQRLVDVIASDNMLTIGVEYFNEALEVMELFREESHKLLKLFEGSNKLNFKLDDITVKIHKKIDKSKDRRISKSVATNIRGSNAQKVDYLISTGMLLSEKIDRTTYLMKP